ncbi:hypothetical protein [Aurantiacibacter poecillastricola]|uniref:hypothetical protein n=1 Tax=Aurantiacibacter poecillastricola TaxID=3064385 RepID=UPI00273F9097|nr:hypothetical protein [Aurantiacibacter sp. 219JJ12-13]MDP5260113.1 hypothetical protein [Aurantiacibacter sp. 219JJ12-13]
MAAGGFYARKRLNWKLIVLIAALHIAVLYGLARALAPEFTASVMEQASPLVTVTVSTYEEEPPEVEPSISPPQPDEGAAAEAGKEAVAREVVAPEQPLPRPSPAPRASSTGTANTSGAADRGEGTGAGGEGSGTGSGRSGSGQGGAVAVGPSVRSGAIDSASDFPIPEGGRAARFGTSVTVQFTVTPDGRARDCSIRRSTADAETAARVCPLVMERIRFNPARDAAGNPVPARYGWRQDFSPRD